MVHRHLILLKFVVYDDYAGEAVHYYSNQSNNSVVGTDLDEIEIVSDSNYDDDDANCFVDNFEEEGCYCD